jgi:hypothetical protein
MQQTLKPIPCMEKPSREENRTCRSQAARKIGRVDVDVYVYVRRHVTSTDTLLRGFPGVCDVVDFNFTYCERSCTEDKICRSCIGRYDMSKLHQKI